MYSNLLELPIECKAHVHKINNNKIYLQVSSIISKYQNSGMHLKYPTNVQKRVTHGWNVAAN